VGIGSRPVALVTGGSRGVGAATAGALADRGYDICLTYRNKAARAGEVADLVRRRGGRALPLACDMTKEHDRRRLLAELTAWATRLDVLVLNASGGLERDLLAADPDYPMHINRDAQVAFLNCMLPMMPRRSTVVFVTSHWAHRFGTVEQLPAYGPIAASKHAGEQVLRARQGDLLARDVRLIVVTGDLIEGTITHRLLERGAPGMTGEREHTTGGLPTAADLGAAIAAAATDSSLPTGHTVVVGGALDSLPLLAP
jgi:NAD(P)-dependent dehydrogenase (short-subunit alcohol dehydrogenase family)